MKGLTIKNGQYPVVLIAGGPADRFRELQEQLGTTRHIFAKYHWEWNRPRSFKNQLPKDVDFVILLHTMIGHAEYDKVKRLCRDAGIPLVLTKHSWTNISAGLYSHGFKADMRPVPAFEKRKRTPQHEPAAETHTSEVLLSQQQPEPELVPGFEPVVLSPPGLLPNPTQPEVVPVPVVFSESAGPIALPATNIRVETLSLIVRLQQMLVEDGIETLMLSPTEINIAQLKEPK